MTVSVAGYSSQVRMELRVGDELFPLAQIGGEKLIFDREVQLPGTTGQVVLSIDGRKHVWNVYWLPNVKPSQVVPARFEYV